MTCECGNTNRGTCPRCQRRIDQVEDERDHPADWRADAAENRHETYLLGSTA